MYGHLQDEVVVGAGGCSQIPDSHVTVGADCAEHAIGMGTPLDAICTGVCWQGEQALFSFWVPDLD